MLRKLYDIAFAISGYLVGFVVWMKTGQWYWGACVMLATAGIFEILYRGHKEQD